MPNINSNFYGETGTILGVRPVDLKLPSRKEKGRHVSDNWCVEVGRNSRPARWTTESSTPTVATGHQSVKRGEMWGSHKPDMAIPASWLLWWAAGQKGPANKGVIESSSCPTSQRRIKGLTKKVKVPMRCCPWKHRSAIREGTRWRAPI